MQITNLNYFNDNNTYYTSITVTGDSDAVDMQSNFTLATVLLSSVSGGSAKVQYSLSPKAKILDDTAIWHDWALGDVANNGGMAFDSPITYLRVVAGNAVTYTLEVLK